MDYSRLLRLPIALSSIDAMSCYDRIEHAPASLAMQRQGAPPKAVHSMLKTLQEEATHKIRTAFGVSKKGFGPVRPPLGGIGQGNGAGPTIWACISDALIAMLKTAGFGFAMLTAIMAMTVKFVCYTLVDDTDLVQLADTPETD